MRIVYVIMTNRVLDMRGEDRQRVLAVCPDEDTASQYVDESDLDCMVVCAPLMETSRPTMRGGE